MVRFGQRPVVPENQADATLSQDNPVSGTKYTVLDTTKNVRIIGIEIDCTWTVQPTPLEIHVTIDGIAMIFAQTNPVSATPYRALLNPAYAADNQFMTAATNLDVPFLIEGRSVKVEVETTGGTVSNLSAKVKYAKF